MDWRTFYEAGKSYVVNAFKDEAVDRALQVASDKLLGDDDSGSGSQRGSTVSLGGKFSLSVSDPAAPTVTAGAGVNSAAAYSARWTRIMANARANARGTTVKSPITITSRINRPRQRRIT
tara:strand:- start:640 stop:999 length:360 start_codon:yes stop_codon:yes gene_type:complete